MSNSICKELRTPVLLINDWWDLLHGCPTHFCTLRVKAWCEWTTFAHLTPLKNKVPRSKICSEKDRDPKITRAIQNRLLKKFLTHRYQIRNFMHAKLSREKFFFTYYVKCNTRIYKNVGLNGNSDWVNKFHVGLCVMALWILTNGQIKSTNRFFWLN